MFCTRCQRFEEGGGVTSSFRGVPLPPLCPECLGFLEPRSRRSLWSATDVLFALALVLAALVAVALLNGCGGSPFTTAQPLTNSNAGAGGYPQTMPQAGAGVGAVAGAAGYPQTTMPRGGAGGAETGTGGAPTASAGSAPVDCLAEWDGSTCDVCTGAPAPAAGRSCTEVIDCYQAAGCRPETCSGRCDYPAPTSDEAVRLAHAVIACRCGVHQ